MTVGPGGNSGQVFWARAHAWDVCCTDWCKTRQWAHPPIVERGAVWIEGHPPRQITALTPRRARLHDTVYHLRTRLLIRRGPKQLPRVATHQLLRCLVPEKFEPTHQRASSAAIREAGWSEGSDFAASFQSAGLRREHRPPLVRLRHAVVK